MWGQHHFANAHHTVTPGPRKATTTRQSEHKYDGGGKTTHHECSMIVVVLRSSAEHEALAAHVSHGPEVWGVPNDAKSTDEIVAPPPQSSESSPGLSPAVAHSGRGGAGTRVNGLGTTTVACSTPMGRLTESDTAPPPSDTVQFDVMGPEGEENVPATEAGPTRGCTCGATETRENAGAADVMPATCFHLRGCHGYETIE
jgi:hypothetical protein